MGLFDKIKESVFLKEDSNSEAQLLALQNLAKTASGPIAEQIEQEIKYASKYNNDRRVKQYAFGNSF